MKLNAIIFHTNRLPELRSFYEGILELPTGTYQKDGKILQDYSDTYVNYHLPGALLCFEFEEGRTDMGTVVLNVPDFSGLKRRLEERRIKILGGNNHYFKVKDPDGRSLIFEPL